jgi:HAD domain in Swiss Army Knife RNA repair proteins
VEGSGYLRYDVPKPLQRDALARPILFVDVDGVLSLFGWHAPPGPMHMVDGVPHCLPPAGGKRLSRLSESFELVWATGWEEKANEYLPHLLELPFQQLPYLTFDGPAQFGTAHWKLGAIDRYAGDRPMAWIDDSIDEQCLAWARRREAPTLIVQTESSIGITDEHVEELERFASAVGG